MGDGNNQDYEFEKDLNPSQEDILNNVEESLNPDNPEINNPDANSDSNSAAQNAETAAGNKNFSRGGISNSLRSGDSSKSSTSGGGSVQKMALSGFKKLAQRNAPLAAVIGIIGVMVAVLLSTFGVGLTVVQVRDALVSSLHDAAPDVDLRAKHILKSKIDKPATAKLGSCKFGFRCKYKSFTSKQVEKLKKAGIQLVDESGNPVPTDKGRVRPAAMQYIDADGKTVKVNAKQFLKTANTDAVFRSQYIKGTQSVFKTIRGKAFAKVAKKLHFDFSRKTGGTKEEVKKQIDETVEKGSSTDMHKSRLSGDAEVSEQERVAKNNVNELRGKKNVASKIANISKVLSVTDTLDRACTVTRMVQMSAYASQVLKYAQLARYAVIFLNVADSIVVGEATPESVDYVASKLTDIDTREKIPDSSSLSENGKFNLDTIANKFTNGGGEDRFTLMVDNPYKGKNAFDSPGLQSALYGNAKNITTRDAQYQLGSGLDASAYGIVSAIWSKVPNAESKCDLVQNPIVQAGSMIAGIGVAIGSGGTSAIAQIAMSGASMIAESLVYTMIENGLNKLFNTQLVNSETAGVDMGNALFSGSGALLGMAASTKGLTPISTEPEIVNKRAISAVYEQKQAEVARLEAKDQPFNVYDKYSFLGSIVAGVAPKLYAAKSSAQILLLSPFSLISSASQSLSDQTHAISFSDPERYRKCKNPLFTGILGANSALNTNINLQSADIMCNIRYGIDPIYLNSDPNRVVAWMVDSAQVDNATGDPLKDKAKMKELNESRDPSVNFRYDNQNATPSDEFKNVFAKREFLQSDVADILRPDNDTLAFMGIPENTPSKQLASFTPGYNGTKLANSQAVINDSRYYPFPISTNETYQPELKQGENGADYNVERDVRSYAHWYRYCRFGPEDGRSVNFGLAESENKDPSLVDKMGLGIIESEYVSNGKECLKSNVCKPGQDPNGAGWVDDEAKVWTGQDAAASRCRPPQYDIYEVYHVDNSVEKEMDEDPATAGGDGTEGGQTTASGDLVTGEARELAAKLANHPNMSWQNGNVTKDALLKFAETGEATNSCGQSFAPSADMTRVLLTMLDSGWRITGNNIGFAQDRSFCDGGMHPKGRAIDITSLQSPDGKKTGPTITYGSQQEVETITEFTTQWFNLAGKIDKKMGRVGQIGCGGFNMIRLRSQHPDWEGADGNMHFNDACNHLHIDVGMR